MKKRIRIIIVAALVVAAGVGIGTYLIEKGPSSPTGQIKLYGNVDLRTADLGFNEQARIDRVLVEEGQRVEAGQPLAQQDLQRINAQIAEMQARIGAQGEVVKRLEAGSRPQEIEQARAEVEAAQATVANARASLARLKTTSGAGVTSIQTFDDARAQLEVAKAQLKVRQKSLALALAGPRQEDIDAARKTLLSMEASLALLQVRQNDMTLLAPAAGIIRNRIMEPGEIGGPNRAVVTLALTDPKWVRAYVPEPDLGRVKLGQKAKIFSDSHPGHPFDGWVGFISPMAEFTPKTVETTELRTSLVYEIRIFAHDPDNLLRLGMPVTVVIEAPGDAGDRRQHAAVTKAGFAPGRG